MEKKQVDEGTSLSLDLPPELALGTYSNLVVISHSSSEFVLDFARLVPGPEVCKVVSRIIMTPDHAKRLLRALRGNVSRFEDQHGEIVLPEQHEESMRLPFSVGSAPEA